MCPPPVATTSDNRFAKLSYSAIDNVLTNLLPAGLQDFFQVLNVSNASFSILLIKSFRVLRFYCLERNSFNILSTSILFQLATDELMFYEYFFTCLRTRFHIYIYCVSDDVI